MPLIKSAIKKMRQDRVRTKANRSKRASLKKVLKETLVKPSAVNLSASYSALDKAVKIGLIPKGRANRQKARLAKKLSTPKNSKADLPAKTKKSTKKTVR